MTSFLFFRADPTTVAVGDIVRVPPGFAPIAHQASLVFGREEASITLPNLCLLKHKFASSQHLRVTSRDNGDGSSQLLFEHIGRNPTFVNGSSLRSQPSGQMTLSHDAREAKGITVAAIVSFPPDIPLQGIIFCAIPTAKLPQQQRQQQQQQQETQVLPETTKNGPQRRDRENDGNNSNNSKPVDQLLATFDMGTNNGNNANTSNNNDDANREAANRARAHEIVSRGHTGGTVVLSDHIATGADMNNGTDAPASRTNIPGLGAQGTWQEVLMSRRRSSSNIDASNQQQQQQQEQQQQPRRVPSNSNNTKNNNNNSSAAVVINDDDDDEDMTPPPKKIFNVPSYDVDNDDDNDNDAAAGGFDAHQKSGYSSNQHSPSSNNKFQQQSNARATGPAQNRPARWQWKCQAHLPDESNAAWRDYDAPQSKMLEEAFRARKDRCNLDNAYAVAFCDADVGMVQYRRDDTQRWRAVRRIGARDVDRKGIKREHICYPDGGYNDGSSSSDDDWHDGSSSDDDDDSDDSFLTDDDSDDETYVDSEDSMFSILSDSSSDGGPRRRRRGGRKNNKKKPAPKRKPAAKRSPRGKRANNNNNGDDAGQQQPYRRPTADFSDEDDIPFSRRAPK